MVDQDHEGATDREHSGLKMEVGRSEASLEPEGPSHDPANPRWIRSTDLCVTEQIALPEQPGTHLAAYELPELS
jgi:hypothetical protein